MSPGQGIDEEVQPCDPDAAPPRCPRWYEKHGPLRGTGAPVVAVLLYRKHVITKQYYVPQLISKMEVDNHTHLPGYCCFRIARLSCLICTQKPGQQCAIQAEGVIPLPVFINGVEAHTIVRDQLTTVSEQEALRAGTLRGNPTLQKDAVQVRPANGSLEVASWCLQTPAHQAGSVSVPRRLRCGLQVDAIVSTIGFPLVGGPAGLFMAICIPRSLVGPYHVPQRIQCRRRYPFPSRGFSLPFSPNARQH